MAKYTAEQARVDAKELYKTVAGKRFFNHLMDEAGIGKSISNLNHLTEQKEIGAHNFVVESICNRLTK